MLFPVFVKPPGNSMDTIANVLTTLLNAQRVGKPRVALPFSKLTERLLEVLKSRRKVADMRLQEGQPGQLIVQLQYEGKEPAIRGVRRVSKPGGRKHVSKENLPYPSHGEGFYVVSTSRGMMDEKKARREGLGGELMCEIW